VFLEELTKGLRANAGPSYNRISIGGDNQGSRLFSAIDTSGDGRLSVRKMRTAADRLNEADKNGDGIVTLEELPATIRVLFGRGVAAYNNLYQRTRTTSPRSSVPAVSRGPE